MSRQLPVTPVESAAWMNRLMQDMWGTFWQPFLLANNLSMWQVRCDEWGQRCYSSSSTATATAQQQLEMLCRARKVAAHKSTQLAASTNKSEQGVAIPAVLNCAAGH